MGEDPLRSYVFPRLPVFDTRRRTSTSNSVKTTTLSTSRPHHLTSQHDDPRQIHNLQSHLLGLIDHTDHVIISPQLYIVVISTQNTILITSQQPTCRKLLQQQPQTVYHTCQQISTETGEIIEKLMHKGWKIQQPEVDSFIDQDKAYYYKIEQLKWRHYKIQNSSRIIDLQTRPWMFHVVECFVVFQLPRSSGDVILEFVEVKKHSEWVEMLGMLARNPLLRFTAFKSVEDFQLTFQKISTATVYVYSICDRFWGGCGGHYVSGHELKVDDISGTAEEGDVSEGFVEDLGFLLGIHDPSHFEMNLVLADLYAILFIIQRWDQKPLIVYSANERAVLLLESIPSVSMRELQELYGKNLTARALCEIAVVINRKPRISVQYSPESEHYSEAKKLATETTKRAQLAMTTRKGIEEVRFIDPVS